MHVLYIAVEVNISQNIKYMFNSMFKSIGNANKI